jgi:TATA-binding protein-associated factor Taf7
MRLREAIGESVFMRTITSVCFGLALALSAFALTSAPASALEAPAIARIVQSGVTKVEEGYREEREERCEHVRRECHERHGDREEFRECVERHHCEHHEREHAERCERVRDECRERHPEHEEFRECLARHDCG